MKRAAAATVGRQCRSWHIDRSGPVLTTLSSVLSCTPLHPSATFAAFSRRRRDHSPKPQKPVPAPPPPPPPPPAAPARPRPKHAAPYPVTLAQIRAYHEKQSFFSRLAILRSRLHHTFQLILATPTTPQQPISAAIQAALQSTTRVFRTFAPFAPPFPRNLYHHFLTIHALTSPITAHSALNSGRRLGLVGEQDVLAVMESYARHGDGEKVQQLLDEVKGRGERVTVRMYEALMEGVRGDADKLNNVREEMKQQGVTLSDKCWLLMLPAYTSNQPATAGLQRLLADVAAERAPITADLAHAIVQSFPPSDYMPALQSARGAAVLDVFVQSQMEYHLSHPTASSPEQLHYLLLSTPSLHDSSRAWSMILCAYVRREHAQTGKIALYDVLVVEQLLADMAAKAVAEDEWALQVRMMLAAQRGEGDNVLALMKQTVQSFHPPASLFLPVLRSVASLTHPQRLPVLLALHSYLHSQRLSSQFSFSLVLSLQSSLTDIAGIRSTLATMKAASIPLTMYHWHQLLLSSPNSKQVALLRDMMTKLHVLPSAYADAIVLSKQTTLRDAEHYYASLRKHHAASPHPVIRVAMADVYGSVGAVRWACRQWWKVVSGSAEIVTKAEDESLSEWTVMGELTEEEMDRMLRRLQTADVGSRSDVREMRERLRATQQRRQKRETDEVQHYRLLLDLPIELTDEQQRVEALRQATQQQQTQATPLLTQRMLAQQVRLEAGLQQEVLEMADRELVKQFGDLVRRLKARVPYVHMDILETKEAEDERHGMDQEAEAATATEDEQQQQQVDWMRDAEDANAKAKEEKAVFVDLDEAVKKRAKQQARAAERKKGGESKDVPLPQGVPRSAVEDEDLLMMEAARQMVASRRPKADM